MFSDLEKARIKIQDINKLQYVPNIISIGPLNQLAKASDWLFKRSVEDYKKTNKAIEKRRRLKGYSKKDLDAWSELSIRLGSRTQAYVNQLCLMEDILIYEYNRMVDLIEIPATIKITLTPKDYSSLIDRFSPIRIFRNKITAHTAYTYPKVDKKTGEKIDNPETVVRSILNLFPGDNSVYMGRNFFSGFSPYLSQIPIISIFEWEDKFRPIFIDWASLFISKLKAVHKECPIKSGGLKIDIDNYKLAKEVSSLNKNEG